MCTATALSVPRNTNPRMAFWFARLPCQTDASQI